jgi:AbrB family looped-hinge helix DNA binding protein
MVEAVTTIDKAGRVVIPKEIREKANLTENSVLLVTETEKGDVLLLKKLDIREIAERIRGELKGKNLDEIAKKVEKESNEEARTELRRRNLPLRH